MRIQVREGRLRRRHDRARGPREPQLRSPLRHLTPEVEGESADGAAEGTELELDAPWSRLAMYADAGALTLLGLLTALTGVLVLRFRRR